MSNAFYAISKSVPKGTGDYGSDHKTVFQGTATLSTVQDMAASIAREDNTEVSVFKGRDIGKLVYIANPP